MARFSLSTWILIIQTIVLACVGIYIFLFGIPPALKSYLQEEALEYMGENKASYMMKKGVDMLPESDETKGIRKGLKQGGGGALQNPLGKFGGDAMDDASKAFK